MTRRQRFAHVEQAAQLVERSDRLANILQPDDFGMRFKLSDNSLQVGLVDKDARGKNRLHLRRLASGDQRSRPSRVVEHGGHAAGRLQREIRNRRAIGVGQHLADIFARRGEGHDLAAQHRRADQQPLGGELAGDRVFQHHLLHAVVARRLMQRFDKQAVAVGGFENQVRHHVIERGARRLAPRLAAQRVVEFELARRHEGDAHFREQASPHLAAFQPREIRALKALQPHRHHHRVGLVGNHRRAVIDFHQ